MNLGEKKIEDQSIDYFFFSLHPPLLPSHPAAKYGATLTLHGADAIEMRRFNFEMAEKGKLLPLGFFFFHPLKKRRGTGRVLRLKKKKRGGREREQERQFPLAGAASKCSAVGQKGPRVIIDPPSVPDSLCPGA